MQNTNEKKEMKISKEVERVLDKWNQHFIEFLAKTDFNMSRIVEAFLMFVALWWAFLLLLPISTFATSSMYAPMAMVASEWVWAGYFLFLGIVQWVGLRYEKKKAVLNGLLLSTITWMFVGTMMVIGSFASTGAGVYVLISALSASVYFYKGIEH